MQNVICSKIEIIHKGFVEQSTDSDWILKQGVSPVTILADNGIKYQVESSTEDSLDLIVETVTVNMNNSKVDSWVTSALKYYLLKVYGKDGCFIVGKKDYPAVKSISISNGATVTFIAKKPA